MKDRFDTWEEAKGHLPMLTFDLGESPSVIEEHFNEGYILKYSHRYNFYYWVGEGDLQYEL